MFSNEEKEEFLQHIKFLSVMAAIFFFLRFIFGFSFFPVTDSYIEKAYNDPIVSKLVSKVFFSSNYSIGPRCSLWNTNEDTIEYCDALSKRLWDLGYTPLTLRPQNLINYSQSFAQEQDKKARDNRVECLANGGCQ